MLSRPGLPHGLLADPAPSSLAAVSSATEQNQEGRELLFSRVVEREVRTAVGTDGPVDGRPGAEEGDGFSSRNLRLFRESLI